VSPADDGVKMSSKHVPGRVRPSPLRGERVESAVKGLVAQVGALAYAYPVEDAKDLTLRL
jgi:hypothetical protein